MKVRREAKISIRHDRNNCDSSKGINFQEDKSLPANMENTRIAGMGIKLPTANATTSETLANVIDGPTSTSALLIRPSMGNSSRCLFTA